ncbi:MAG: hypothetical protein UU93_C0023G0005 [Candidatus Amesbacteria bacterium GW2011_GWA2_42_12]|uniref:Peptidase M24 n=1 Tax=Candidatus Amesbacteria bacterium GW2011_GWA2_42_12 TaxID=1618356 RepID=A0A0G1B0K4_9BACT|nr:MAG: hypothetical protein UU93_C0023G0005 [Candidatus Amesbacteria bacterium GW2011_GWA2_42_12]
MVESGGTIWERYGFEHGESFANMITLQTVKSRLVQMQNVLKERRYSGALFSSAMTIRYLTGFAGLSPEEREVLLVVLPNRTVLCCPMMYEELARDLTVVKNGMVEISVDTQRQGLLKCAVGILDPASTTKIGIEESNLRVSEMKKLESLLEILSPQLEFVNISGIVETIRSVKDTEELKTLKNAQELTIKTFDRFERELLGIDYTKLTELDCAEKIRHIALELGADGLAFESIVASGASASQPHYQSAHKHIEDNAVLLVDMGVKVDGYNGDYTRTILLGTVDEELHRIHRAVTETNQQCQKACVAGVTGEKLYELQRSIYTKHQLDPNMPHSLGHGLGLEVHEQPLLRPNPQQILAKNMVVTIEPGYYEPGKFGVRVEDVVVI